MRIILAIDVQVHQIYYDKAFLNQTLNYVLLNPLLPEQVQQCHPEPPVVYSLVDIYIQARADSPNQPLIQCKNRVKMGKLNK